jgi:hypothetical protein
MADNTILRQNARSFNATCRAYVQGEGNCRGTVAWWVRARLQSKSIWGAKYFDDIDDPADPGIGQRRSIATDHYDPQTSQLLGTDRGLTKSRILEELLQGDEPLLAYILHGLRTDKEGRGTKTVGKLANRIVARSLGDLNTGDDAGTIGRSFVEASLNKYVSYFSITTIEFGQNHAIGLDGSSSPTMVYFDPNIGEITFTSVVDLVKWWRQAYVWRNDPHRGAFRIFDFMYRGFHFRKGASTVSH